MTRPIKIVGIVLCCLMIIGFLAYWGFIKYSPLQNLTSYFIDPVVRQFIVHKGYSSGSENEYNLQQRQGSVVQQPVEIQSSIQEIVGDSTQTSEESLPDCARNSDGSYRVIYNEHQTLCRIPPVSAETAETNAGKLTFVEPKPEDYLDSKLKSYLGTELLQLTVKLANKKGATNDELVNYALTLINKDRKENHVPPVTLHQNKYSQVHAEDMVKYGYVGHWTSDGLKPYMGYTAHGGEGAVAQNAGYQYCTPYCTFNPVISILRSHYGMMYEDSECCEDGHKKTILYSWHNEVSISIAHNDKYFAFVQDFQNSYIYWKKPISYNNGISNLNGISKFEKINQIAVFYDPMPGSLTAEELRNTPRSYDAGELIGNVLPPLPEGHYYQPSNHVQVVASQWEWKDNGHFNITFDLHEFYRVKGSGVYTIYVWSEQSEDLVELTSHSFFVK